MLNKMQFYQMVILLLFGLSGQLVKAATDCNQVTEIPFSECQSLLELYNSTGGDNWWSKDRWKQDNNPCGWYGIRCEFSNLTTDLPCYMNGAYNYNECSVGTGYVTEIRLHHSGAKGVKVPLGNNLIGQIPNLNLPNLRYLSLSSNQLSGSIPNFNLPNLQQLSLSSNQLSGSIPNFNLPNLQQLSLSSNQLSGSIPNFNLPNLQQLSLSSNQLSGSIPNFTNLPNLQEIYLGNNQLSGAIPNFTNLHNLAHLWLSSNQLNGSIPNFSSFNLANLQYAQFNNNCGLTAYDSNQESILNQQDPIWKTKNPNCPFSLTLNKSGNGLGTISGNGTFIANTTVNLVATPDTNSTFTGWSPLPCANLFQMPANDLVCTANFSKKVTDCNAVTEIPVSECQSLLEFYNSTNGTNWTYNTGWNQTNTPCSWLGITCTSGHVSEISLSSKNLKGTLPDLNLPYLRTLHLSYNQLGGYIPNFSNLSNLRNLLLYHNQFIGSIPNFLNLPNLLNLELNYNSLDGIIPVFDKLSNLEYLNLETNKLTGNIPDFNLLKLKELRLSSNQLMGSIPNFTNLPVLQQLNLSHNQLTGTIPNFDKLNNLQVLSLSSNQLSGNIPNFDKLTNLGVLDLESNYLYGVIPNFVNFDFSKSEFYLAYNCGLTAYNSAQETILNEREGDPIMWKKRNPKCPTYKVIVINKGLGAVTGNGSYGLGLPVTLTATSDVNSTFIGWTPSPCANSFQMPANDLTCTATFEKQRYAITTTISNGGSINPSATEVEHGNTTTFSINLPNNFAIDSVTGCNGSLNGTTYTTGIITAPCQINVQLKQLFVLNVISSGNGQVNGSGNFAAGTPISLTTIPNNDYRFVGWSPSPCASSFQMPANDLTCTATFEQIPVEKVALTVTKTGNGKITGVGIDCGVDCNENYNLGTSVSLTAIPDKDWQISTWEGNCSGHNSTISIEMNTVKNCNIVFTKIPRPIIRVEPSSLKYTSGQPTIDVLVAYTPAAAQKAEENGSHILVEIQKAINQANVAYENSNVQQRLRLVHIAPVNYTEGTFGEDLSRLTATNDQFMDNIHGLRNQYKADVVSLIRSPDNNSGYYYCGLSPIPKNELAEYYRKHEFSPALQSIAFSLVGISVDIPQTNGETIHKNCINQFSLAHELGHNMGAGHDIVEEYGIGIQNYSRGYTYIGNDVEASWRTIVTTPSNCDAKFGVDCTIINHFSNPDISYQGQLTGNNVQNNARTLNETAETVSMFRSEDLGYEVMIITVHNDGDADLTISSITPNNSLISVTPNSNITVAPSKFVPVQITTRYAPSGSSLTISSNATNGNSLNIPIQNSNFYNNFGDMPFGEIIIPLSDPSFDSQKVAAFNMISGKLDLRVRLPNIQTTYQTELDLVPTLSNTFLFKLQSAIQVADQPALKLATYDELTQTVEIPVVNVPDEKGMPRLFKVKMQLVPQLSIKELTFEVLKVEPIEIRFVE